jgi:hypothetical protein
MFGRRDVRADKRPEPSGLLNRPVDRFERRLRRLTPALMIVACTLAVLTGAVVWSVAAASETAQPVVSPTAVRAVTDSAAAPVSAQTVGTPAVTVRAHWQWPAERHDGVIAVPAGTPKGTTKDIMVDERGNWLPPGVAFGGPISRVVPSVLLALLVGVGGILVVRQATRRAVEQRHDRYWTERLGQFFATQAD